MISVQGGHLEVVNALLEVGGRSWREVLMLTGDDGVSCHHLSAYVGGASGVVKSLLETVGRELLRKQWLINGGPINNSHFSYHIGLSKMHSCVRGPALCLHPGPARPRSNSEAEMVAVVAARP
jgi:hypothetical protein